MYRRPAFVFSRGTRVRPHDAFSIKQLMVKGFSGFWESDMVSPLSSSQQAAA
jgi:hypothetical protein